MKKIIFFLVVCLIIPTSIHCQNKKGNVLYTKKELISLILKENDKLPHQIKDGLWSQSITYNKDLELFTCTFKAEPKYADLLTPEYFDIMRNDIKKIMVDTYKELNYYFILYKLSVKWQYLNSSNNSIIGEFEITPQYIKNQLEKSKSSNKIHNDLSFYRKGYTSERVNLPIKINEYLTWYDVSMPKNIVYYDYYCNENCIGEINNSTGDFVKNFKQDMLKNMKNAFSLSNKLKRDALYYKIKFYYRFFDEKSHKFLFQIIIDPAKYY